MDSGGGAWPKDLNIKQVVESYLGLPNLTLHGLLGLDTEAESQLREYLAQAYGSDPARANTFAREDVELAEPVGRCVSVYSLVVCTTPCTTPCELCGSLRFARWS